MPIDEKDEDMPCVDDLMVWYVPQIPMASYRVKVPDLTTAVLVHDAIVGLSSFEYENKVKPDYSDASGISRWEPDGEGGFDWFDVDESELRERGLVE